MLTAKGKSMGDHEKWTMNTRRAQRQDKERHFAHRLFSWQLLRVESGHKHRRIDTYYVTNTTLWVQPSRYSRKARRMRKYVRTQNTHTNSWRTWQNLKICIIRACCFLLNSKSEFPLPIPSYYVTNTTFLAHAQNTDCHNTMLPR